jgi:formamidopyrimidine-DNA glycosylase
MPELPEVEALAHHLREHALYRPVARVDVASMSAVKTFDPPVSALVGRVVTGAARYGKFLAVEFADRPDEPLHLITHLSRAGWLRWSDALSSVPPRMGKGPLAARVHLDDGSGFDLTEAGTQKRLALYVVHSPYDVPGIARLGPDPLAPGFTRDDLAAILAGSRQQVKGLLRDQSVLAGVGNAYSDEVLHAARLSPFRLGSSLTEPEVDELWTALQTVLREAVDRAQGLKAAELKQEKKVAMRVHGRTGQACPVCGDMVRDVSFANSSLQYCPTCQTGGKPLADRRLSRLLK